VRGNWQGTVQTIDAFHVEVSAGSSSLEAQGSITNTLTQVDLNVISLALLTNSQRVLALAQPVQITFVPPGNRSCWSLNCTPFDGRGAGGELRAGGSWKWPQRGVLSIPVEQISSI